MYKLLLNIKKNVLVMKYWIKSWKTFISNKLKMYLLIVDLDGNSIGRTPTITPVDEGLHDVSYVPPPVGMYQYVHYIDNKQTKKSQNEQTYKVSCRPDV